MPTSVGPYQLGDSLGMTPFGELVLATHSARSEPLAILLLDNRLARDHRFRGLLRLEVARAGGLREAGIARPTEVGEQSSAPYVVVERPAAGRSLAVLLETGELPARDQALAIIQRLAAGLDAAHGRRLVHGAIGPASLLIAPDGNAALVGLGLLAAVEEARLGSMIAEHPDAAFAAPEQHGGRRDVASADGYALSLLAEALLLGRLPSAEPHSVAGDNLPAAAIAAIDLQRSADPAARFPNCRTFAAALAEALTAPTEPSSTPEPAAASARPSPPPSSAPDQPSAPPSLPAIAAATSPSTEPVMYPPTWPASTVPDVREAPPAPAVPPPLPWAVPTSPADPEVGMTLPPTQEVTPTRDRPWSVPVTTDTSAPIQPAPPPAAPSSTSVSDATDKPAPEPAPAGPETNLGTLIRNAIDPPPPGRTAGSASIDVSRRSEAGSTPGTDYGEPTVTTTPLTPAMLEAARRAEQREPLNDALDWLTTRVPPLERLLEQVSSDGKIGPVPVAIAVTGALAAVVLVLGQPIVAAALVMAVVAIDLAPKVLAKLTATERGNAEAVRVSGTAYPRQRVGGPGFGFYELELWNDVHLSLSSAAYAQLSRFGKPIVVERPSVHGIEYVTTGYELAGVTVTYHSTSRLLFDIRDANGLVLYRQSRYEGEPGDLLPAPPSDPVSTSANTAGQTKRSDGASTIRPMSSELRAALKKGVQSAGQQVALTTALPIFIVVVNYGTVFGTVVLIGGVIAFLIYGAGPLDRMLKLSRAGKSDIVERLVGSLIATHVRRRSINRYRIKLSDGVVLDVDEPIYNRLAQGGRSLAADAVLAGSAGEIEPEEIVSRHQLDGLTVTYEPSAPLLLEILAADCTVVYRDRTVPPSSL